MIRLNAAYKAAAGPNGRNSHQRGDVSPLESQDTSWAAAGHSGASAVTKR